MIRWPRLIRQLAKLACTNSQLTPISYINDTDPDTRLSDQSMYWRTVQVSIEVISYAHLAAAAAATLNGS